jgi:hypothetical protein
MPEALDCSACHTVDAWTAVREVMDFDHATVERFPLGGAHARVACRGCHLDLRFDGPDVDGDQCAACHSDVHQARFVDPCVACHVTSSFTSVSGDRAHARTAFPLVGAHGQVTCEGCHADEEGGAFTALDTECVACHRTDWEESGVTGTIDHVVSGYPTECTRCHNVMGWSDAPAFDHVASARGYELIGAHGRLRCASCHVVPGLGLLFTPADAGDCIACHQDDYDENHGGSTFPTTCATCHGHESWEDADFDHDATVFPLAAPHDDLACEDCHHGSSFALRFPEPADADDCVACHEADYDGEHGGSGFPTTCLHCHRRTSWEGVDDHAALSAGFDLVGAHDEAPCTGCHAPGSFVLLFPIPGGQDDCVACHQGDYDGEHGGSGLPTTCLTCHGVDTWEGAEVDHGALSGGFDLVGAHAASACTACHAPGSFVLLFPIPGSQDDCVACHQGDYDGEHGGSGLPTTCLTCHGVDTWEGAEVDHGALSGGFDLVGAHAVSACTACHAPGSFVLLFPIPGSQDDCVACHQGDYDGEHGGSGLPTTCLTCHTVDTWEFDHDAQAFPIYSGDHRNEWDACSDCHTAPYDYGVFSCLSCHEHNQAETDDEHGEVSGYAYESGACLSCHPNGSS